MTKAKVIAVSNFKGGVGKSTCAMQLAYMLSKRGKRILLIDFDPQGTLSFWVHTPEDDSPIKARAIRDVRSVANVVIPKELGVEPLSLSQATYRTRWENVDLVPAYLALQRAKDAVFNNPCALRYAIEDLEDEGSVYDIVIIDTRPDLDNKTTAAFIAAGYVMIPVRSDGAMIEGLRESLAAIDETVDEFRCGPIEVKAFRSMVKENSNRDEFGRMIVESMNDRAFKSVIHDTTKIGEASIEGKSLDEFARRDRERRVVQDFEDLADEVLAWIA